MKINNLTLILKILLIIYITLVKSTNSLNKFFGEYFLKPILERICKDLKKN